MKFSMKVTWAALTALALQHARAQQATTLYIPGFDPQPVNIEILGTGSDGLTTYQVEAPSQGADGQVLTFTLAEGASTAAYTAVMSAADASQTEIDTLEASCDIANGEAVCNDALVAVVNGATSTSVDVETEAASGITVQLVNTGSAASASTTSPTSTQSSTTSTTGTTNTALSTKSSATGTNTTPAPGATTPTTTGTTKNNAASVHGAGAFLLLMVGVSTFGYLLL
ncbi:hypothetical protein M422DRAFT_269277 [Sphaerobolus stellatus SS14]|uniref:Unplaced genomic scaffold SPHSTscaffold_210, whole genome shotgun sequence n=1 Tax=Sphaerobolus stellatus (strain SS14) TaxID=990650 RepID=A0A0C9UVW8_SPHS4|nr:hypothetical protein M422DRAFT_269277 [Sphaerobolus stellatus SS14]